MKIDDDSRGTSLLALAWNWIAEGWFQAARCSFLPYAPELDEWRIRKNESDFTENDAPERSQTGQDFPAS